MKTPTDVRINVTLGDSQTGTQKTALPLSTPAGPTASSRPTWSTGTLWPCLSRGTTSGCPSCLFMHSGMMLLLCLLLARAAAYPLGAPSAACVTRTPQHGAAPQATVPPYSVSLTAYTPGTPLTVTLSGVGGSKFKGFLLQAWLADGSSTVPFGNWTSANGTKTLECSAARDSLTHDSSSPKTSVTVQWMPPAGATARVVILATVVQTKLTFWTDVAAYTDAASSFMITTKYFVPNASFLKPFNRRPHRSLKILTDYAFGHSGVINKVRTYCVRAGTLWFGAWRREEANYTLVTKGSIMCEAYSQITAAPSPVLAGVRATDVLGIHTNGYSIISLDKRDDGSEPENLPVNWTYSKAIYSIKYDSTLPLGQSLMVGEDLKEEDGSYAIPLIMYITEACSELPCLNNATCTSLSEGGYNCTCSAGFAGADCTEDVLECNSNPCMNNGSCIEGTNRFTCDCTGTGKFGATCELDPCSAGPCQNGGACTVSGSSYTCTCTAGWSGDNCTQVVVPLCNRGVNNTNVCKYNGTCTEENGTVSCECKFGYVGTRCETDEWWNPIVLIVRILQWLKWINLYDGRKWTEVIDEDTALTLIADYTLGGETKLFESLNKKIQEKEEMKEDAEKKRQKALVTEKEKQTRAKSQQDGAVSNRARGPANRDRAAGRRGKRAGDQMPYASQQDSKAAHRELERYMKRLGLRNK